MSNELGTAPAEPSSVTVEVSGVRRIYPHGREDVSALQDVSLVIRSRRFVVITGASGSGKTTLLNLIGCLDKPDVGKVIIDGVDTTKLPDVALSDFRARKLGFVFQSFNLIETLSALENVEYPLMMLGVERRERLSRAHEMLKLVGLEDARRRRPNELSGGQKQRVAIARALVKQPQLVLADEPTANLDSGTSERIIALMHQMQIDLQTTFVFSTHDRDLARRADDKFTLHDGSLTVLPAGVVN